LDLFSTESLPPSNATTSDEGHGSLEAGAERRRLIDLYDTEYSVLSADRAERRRAAHRLRYQVYCLENPFEDRSEHPDGLERDEFDDHSVQSLLQRRSDGAAIGTVRLILPDPSDVRGSLPFHRLCRPRVPLIDLLLPVNSMAEVSRFCISKELRRQKAGGPSQATLARYATLGLIRSLVETSIENEITHWCMVVEPALLRFLATLGLKFYPLGPLVEHHGLRQPCHADLAMLLQGVKERRREVWEVITDDGRLVPPATSHRPEVEPEAILDGLPGETLNRHELAEPGMAVA
jgi:N-acyl amino acid synthase of PEP-CTERM/exosortase system